MSPRRGDTAVTAAATAAGHRDTRTVLLSPPPKKKNNKKTTFPAFIMPTEDEMPLMARDRVKCVNVSVPPPCATAVPSLGATPVSPPLPLSPLSPGAPA